MLTDLKQDWTYLAGEGSVFALGYRSTAIMSSPDGGAPVKPSVNYLCVVRLAEGKVAEVWMNGASRSRADDTDAQQREESSCSPSGCLQADGRAVVRLSSG